MPGSHALSVENLRLHERSVEKERFDVRSGYVVRTVTEATTTRPPAQPTSVVRETRSEKAGAKAGSKVASKAGSKAGPKAGSKDGSKAGSNRGGSIEKQDNDKEVLIVTVIEEEEQDEAVTLPPKAPSTIHTRVGKTASAKPPASVHPSHHSHNSTHSRKYDLYHIPVGIPLPPGFSKVPEIKDMDGFEAKEREMALVKLPSLAPAESTRGTLPERQIAKRFPTPSHVSSSHHSNSKTKALESGGGAGRRDEGRWNGYDRGDVIFEEVREVTRRRYVVKMPGDKIGEWRV
ncbi:hypothetical protein KCU95_g3536, partial [Aureobasidium melanogenum]